MAGYVFRAEADVDCTGFFDAIAVGGWAVSGRSQVAIAGGLGGVVCEFDTEAGLDDLLAAASRVVDGHVIYRTLRPGTARNSDLGESIRLEDR